MLTTVTSEAYRHYRGAMSPHDRMPPDGGERDGEGFTDLGFARVDTDRLGRTGDPEVVYGAGKTTQQIVAILTHLHSAHPQRAILATRVADPAAVVAGLAGLTARADEDARAVVVGDLPEPAGLVGIVTAGTSDGPVAAEAELTVAVHGAATTRITDVGVAGLHRVLAARDQLDACDCVIVVAGMEGALPSVVGGLTGTPVVAVPTSVGYGASFGGIAALLGMLNSCAPGVVVVNIDNGYGAGVHAARVARHRPRPAGDPAVRQPAVQQEVGRPAQPAVGEIR